jgi:hypothetical protein
VQRSGRLAALATAGSLVLATGVTALTVTATTATATSISCTAELSPGTAPGATPSSSSCFLTNEVLPAPVALSIVVKLHRTDSTRDDVNWTVYWRSECYDAAGKSLGFSQQTIQGDDGPGGTQEVGVWSPDGASSCTVISNLQIYMTTTSTGQDALNEELDYTQQPSPVSSSSPSPPSPPSASAPAGAIKGPARKCADDAKNSSARRAKVVIWGCSSADRAQRWTFTHGEFRHNGLCLNARGNAANGSAVILWTCNGSAGEIWALQKNNTVALKAHGWKLCLTDPKDAARNGTQLVVSTCRGAAAQRWSVP